MWVYRREREYGIVVSVSMSVRVASKDSNMFVFSLVFVCARVLSYACTSICGHQCTIAWMWQCVCACMHASRIKKSMSARQNRRCAVCALDHSAVFVLIQRLSDEIDFSIPRVVKFSWRDPHQRLHLAPRDLEQHCHCVSVRPSFTAHCLHYEERWREFCFHYFSQRVESILSCFLIISSIDEVYSQQ